MERDKGWRERQRTRPIDSPSKKTTAWSATVAGLVRKKKPRVMWKRQREVRMVRAEMSAMVGSCGRVRRTVVDAC